MADQNYSGQFGEPSAPPNPEAPRSDRLHRHPKQSGRDDTLDEELERERLEPGLNSEGTGGAGADPDGPHDGGNSNT